MGLDATVYCNCFETGKLKEQPDQEVFVCHNGSLECQEEDLDIQLAFDQWLYCRACDHANGILVHHRIGNIALVGLLREELKLKKELFPYLLSKILYNGIHGGDFLPIQDFSILRAELDQLTTFSCSSKRNAECVDWFRTQMVELLEAAESVSKPISF